MSDISDQIQSLALFGKFNNKQLEYLVEESNTVTLSEDEQIFEQDDESDDCFYVVLAGSIGIEKLMRDEKELVATLEPGDFFGELGLFSGGTRQAG
ncbi:MAG: cyclic nucleotide-binding domain-containing protein, partial [bacterium]